jgi:hypothetical protein
MKKSEVGIPDMVCTVRNFENVDDNNEELLQSDVCDVSI